jgi:hypothetical protein
MQYYILNNVQKFIKKKIYFTDNFNNLTDADWNLINKTIEERDLVIEKLKNIIQD